MPEKKRLLPEVPEDLDSRSLKWRDVGRQVFRAPRKDWVFGIGLPVLLGIATGAIQWLLNGADESAWDGVTANNFLAPLIALGCAVMVLVFARVWSSAVTRGRAEITAHRNAIRELRAENAELRSRITERTPLERWLQQRVDAAGVLERERHVQGDKWYFEQMREWDTANVSQMALGNEPVAPYLVDDYRRDPGTGHVDGIVPPHGVREKEEYFARRLAWLNQTLRTLRTGPPTVPPVQRALQELDAQRHSGEWVKQQLELGHSVPVSGKGVLPPAELLKHWTQQTAGKVARYTTGERTTFLRDEIPVDRSDLTSVLRSRLHQLDLIIDRLRVPGSERLIPPSGDE